MHTETVANLFLEEIQDVRSVEQQIAETLTRMAEGVSIRRLSAAAAGILRKTEQRVARLERIFHEIGPAHHDATISYPAVAERIPRAFEPGTKVDRRPPPSSYAQLTPREVQVLKLIAEGSANKQIAAELDISIKTVEKHRQHLMAKLDLHDTAGVTRYAISAGVVEAVA